MPTLFSLKKQQGFTLFEIILAVSLLGALSMTLTPAFKTFLAVKDSATRDTEAAINQRVVKALLAWSENAGPGSGLMGTLPAPCSHTTDKVFYAATHLTRGCGTTLAPYLMQENIAAGSTNTDGRAGQNVRVYQRLTGLGQYVGIFGPSGPAVFLPYEVAAVYSTNCNKTATCGLTKLGVVPATGVLTSVTDAYGGVLANPAWAPVEPVGTPVGSVYGLAYGSTLPMQKKLLQATADRLLQIRDAMKAYAKVRLAEPGWGAYVTAWNAAHPGRPAVPYPTVSDAACASATPPTAADCAGLISYAGYWDQGCWDGWYSLDGANSDILQQIGIGSEVMGRTAWGSSIEYCRDYDPNGPTAGVAPHYAALRVLSQVANGMPPDSSAPGSNLVVSF